MSLLLFHILGLIVQDSAELRQKASLTGIASKQQLLRNYALPEDAAATDKPKVKKANLGRTPVLFIDVNGNGRFDDLGIDGWTVAGQQYIFPLEEKVILGTDEIRLHISEDAKEVRFKVEPIQAKKTYLDALVQQNELRMRNGVPPASLDPTLTRACEKHSSYCDRHGMTHNEEEGKSGYSEEGAQAGVRSCLSSESPVESVWSFYKTFYHRIPLLHPATRYLGIGATSRNTSIDGMSSREERPWQWPLLVPAPDSKDQPTAFSPGGEIPMPYAQGLEPGLPITVTYESGEFSDVVAELRVGGPRGKLVEILLSSPDRPANSQLPSNDYTICLIPKVKLRPKTVYAVRVAYTRNGETAEHKWAFVTGNQ